MGWNDRLPEDPYIPTESYYERQEYEAWMEYLESLKSPAAGLSSQNIDPATLPSTPAPSFMQRLLTRVFGAEPQKAANERDETPSPF